MASTNKTVGSAPVHLLKDADGTWVLTKEGKEYLNSLKKGVKPVCVCGVYRSGKSLLMNRLLGQKKGFELGHKAEGKTQGLWIWANEEKDHYLLAIDCEGLFDVKGNPTRDAQLAVFAVLFSSLLILNVKSVLDAKTLASLAFFADLTEHIKSGAKSADEEDGESFCHNFPHLLFLIRDFFLGLDDHDNDPDKYLASVLKNQHSQNSQVKKLDGIRDSLKVFFPTHFCRTLPNPTENPEIENIQIDENPSVLRAIFVKQLDVLISEIKEKTPLKRLRGEGKNNVYLSLDGPGLLKMMENIVHAVNSKTPPNLEHSFSDVVENHNAQLFSAAVTEFDEEAKKLVFPQETNALREWKGKLLKKITTEKIKQCIGNGEVQFTSKFKTYLEKEEDGKITGGKFFLLCTSNEDASKALCEKLLKELFFSIKEKIKKKEYKSFEEFQKDRDGAQKDYLGKAVGPAKQKSLTAFLENTTKDVKTLMKDLQLDEEKKKSIKLQEEFTKKAAEMAEEARKKAEEIENLGKQVKQNQEIQEEMRKKFESDKKEWEILDKKRQEEVEAKLEKIKKDADDRTREAIAAQQLRFEETMREEKRLAEEDWQRKIKEMDEEHKTKTAELERKIKQSQEEAKKSSAETSNRDSGLYLDRRTGIVYARVCNVFTPVGRTACYGSSMYY